MHARLVTPTQRYATVTLEPGDGGGDSGAAVSIVSELCVLGGPLADAMALNRSFCFRSLSRVTWDDGDGDDGGRSRLAIRSEMHAFVAPPPPLHRLPNALLTRVGHAVIGIALRFLHAAFLDALAADFARWSTDEAYRAARAQAESARRRA